MGSMSGGYMPPMGGTKSAGEGDMEKSVYDVDNDGVVDKAETLDEEFVIEGGNF